jgi:hypothetical protein
MHGEPPLHRMRQAPFEAATAQSSQQLAVDTRDLLLFVHLLMDV